MIVKECLLCIIGLSDNGLLKYRRNETERMLRRLGRGVGVCGDERWCGGECHRQAPPATNTKDTTIRETGDLTKPNHNQINVILSYYWWDWSTPVTHSYKRHQIWQRPNKKKFLASLVSNSTLGTAKSVLIENRCENTDIQTKIKIQIKNRTFCLAEKNNGWDWRGFSITAHRSYLDIIDHWCLSLSSVSFTITIDNIGKTHAKKIGAGAVLKWTNYPFPNSKPLFKRIFSFSAFKNVHWSICQGCLAKFSFNTHLYAWVLPKAIWQSM